MTKKARGVYYTPKPVVDYIVRSTLSPLLEGKSPMQLAGRKSNWEQDRDSHPLTILDPLRQRLLSARCLSVSTGLVFARVAGAVSLRSPGV